MRILSQADLPDHIQLIEIPYGTKEWYDFRMSGIGGSEIGTISQLHDYETVMELYAIKIGIQDPDMSDFQRLFHGRNMEDYIRDTCWQYYDNTPDGFMYNHRKGTPIRSAIKVPGFIVNKKYPWIFISVDGLIDKDGPNAVDFINLEPLRQHGVLEMKNISMWAARAAEDGIPDWWIPQIQLYMKIMETDYAEIAYIENGNNFRVRSYIADPKLQDSILRMTKNFWDNHILPGKQAKIQYDLAVEKKKYSEANHYHGLIQKYEPEPDPSERFKIHRSENFVKERHLVLAPPKILEVAKKREQVRLAIKHLKRAKSKMDNEIINQHFHEKAEYLSLDGRGESRYFKKKGNNKHEIRVTLKDEVDDVRIQQEVSKLKLA